MADREAGPRMIAGRYRLEARLGAGSMGEVHRAFDTRLERTVAIKLVRSPDSAEHRAQFVSRTMREARAAAALRHPNVVAIFDVGDEDGWPYLVLEFLEGRPLSGLAYASVPIRERLRWLRDIAAGLAAAHEAGLTHRDVKPDNVIVCNDGAIKIVDFGIARRVQSAGERPLTAPGTAIGTPAYMSPEQVRGEGVDARADQFSWGVTAYELLTGSLPWTSSASAYALIAAVLSEEIPPPSRRNADVGQAVDAIVLRAVQKDPRKRFSSIRDIVAALDACVAALPSLAFAATQPVSAATASTVGFGATSVVSVANNRADGATPRAIGDSPMPEVGDVRALEAYRAALEHFRDSNWAAAHRELLRAVSFERGFAEASLRLAITGRFDGGMTPEEYRAAFRVALDGRRKLGPRGRALLRAFETQTKTSRVCAKRVTRFQAMRSCTASPQP